MGLFTKGSGGTTLTLGKKKEVEITPEQTEAKNSAFDLNRGLKLLEDRYGNLRRQLQFYEQSALNDKTKLSSEIRATDGQLSDLNNEIHELRDKIDALIKEIGACAKSEDLKVIEKYVDMWEPVNFLTVEQAKKMIEEYLGKK